MKGVGDKVVSLAQRRLRATEEVWPPTFLCSQGPTLESWEKLELCDTRAGGALCLPSLCVRVICSPPWPFLPGSGKTAVETHNFSAMI